MREQPEQPGPSPAKRSAPKPRHVEFDDRRLAADRRQVAVVDVAERRASARRDRRRSRLAAAVRPICLAAGLTPGTGFGAPLPWLKAAARSPITAISRMAGKARGRVRPRRGRRGRARRRSSRPATAAERRGGDAGGPDHGRARRQTVRPGAVRRRASRRSRRRRRCRSPCSRCAGRRRGARAARRRARESFGTKAPRIRSEPSIRTTRAWFGSMRRNSPRSVCCAISVIVPGHLDAGRAAADDHEGQPGFARARIACSVRRARRRR